jgi:hypothetical protein
MFSAAHVRHSINGGHRQQHEELARLIGGDCCYSSLIFISGILRRRRYKDFRLLGPLALAPGVSYEWQPLR